MEDVSGTSQARQQWADDTMVALEALDSNVAEALRAVYFEDMTQAEAAVHLGISAAIIKSRVAVGLMTLLTPTPAGRTIHICQ